MRDREDLTSGNLMTHMRTIVDLVRTSPKLLIAELIHSLVQGTISS